MSSAYNLANEPSSAVVVELTGDVHHWTVVKRVGKHSLGPRRVLLVSGDELSS
jgi:hypothetical protein